MKRCACRILAALGITILLVMSWTAGLYAAGNPPTDFTATYVNDQEVALSWSLNQGAESVEIRFAYGRQPTQPAEGFLVYSGNGTSFSDTGLDMNRTIADVFYSAWSKDAEGNYSTSYAAVIVENTAMTELATALSGSIDSFTKSFSASFTTFISFASVVIAIIIVSALVALAYTKKNPILYTLASLVLLLFSFQWMANDNWFYIGLVTFALGVATIPVAIYEVALQRKKAKE